MRVGLLDIDSKMPNLALMKISAWHKERGDKVSLTAPLFVVGFDKIYASKVFTWTEVPLCRIDSIGGPAVGGDELGDNINDTCPDYSLYGIDYSMGYLTRGCPRRCKDCSVPDLEGDIREEHDIEVFLRHDKVVLLDNNVLAHHWGIQQIEKLIRLKVKVDFNQGLDARLIDEATARLLSRVRWLEPIRLACDNLSMVDPVRKAVENLRKAGATPSDYSCYVLVKDIPTAVERVEFLRKIGVDPFAQPFRDREGTEPPDEHKRFARYVNHKATFKSVRWEQYTG